jgi:hypothetical protein
MPPNSFTLILNGDPLPTHTSHVFDTLLRATAWQDALDNCYESNHGVARNWFGRRSQRVSVFEGFLDAVTRVANGTSVVHCNLIWGLFGMLMRSFKARRNGHSTSGREHGPRNGLNGVSILFHRCLKLGMSFCENLIPEEETTYHPSRIRSQIY